MRKAHERAEWLARFPEENPSPVMRASANGRVLYCNPASVEIPGWFCEVGEQLPESLLPLFAEAVAVGQEIQQDVELGKHVYSVAVVPIPEEGYANIYGRDITDRKRAEEALRESEERYRHLVKYAPTGIYDIDYATGRFTEVNDAMCFMLGYTRDEILAMTAFDILADEGKALLASRIRLGQSGEGLSEAVEYPVRTKNGRLIWALLNTMFHRIDGRIIKATVIASDITERKHAEEELRTALQRLHALFAGMQSSLLLVGEGRIEMANQAFCDYFGLEDTPEDLIGLTPRQLIDKIKNAYLHPDEQVKRIWEIARGGQPVIGEEISMRDGRTSLRDFIPIHVDGKSYGLLWHHIDITELKQAEQILRDRTAELEAANKELESFSYSVSHDLRAPLRAIDGYARMLLKKHGDEFDEDSLRKFNVIRSSSQMMGQLIDDILTLSRVVKKHLSASQMEMDAVIREVWKEIWKRSTRKGT